MYKKWVKNCNHLIIVYICTTDQPYENRTCCFEEIHKITTMESLIKFVQDEFVTKKT